MLFLLVLILPLPWSYCYHLLFLLLISSREELQLSSVTFPVGFNETWVLHAYQSSNVAVPGAWVACIDFICLWIVLRASALCLVWKPSGKNGWCVCTKNNIVHLVVCSRSCLQMTMSSKHKWVCSVLQHNKCQPTLEIKCSDISVQISWKHSICH